MIRYIKISLNEKKILKWNKNKMKKKGQKKHFVLQIHTCKGENEPKAWDS